MLLSHLPFDFFVHIFQKIRVDYVITFSILYATTIKDDIDKTNSRIFIAFKSPLLINIYLIRAGKQCKRRKPLLSVL